MCEHFGLAFKMRDTKAALLAKMEEMISEWVVMQSNYDVHPLC